MPTVEFLNQEIAFTLFDRYIKYLHILTETLELSQFIELENNKSSSLVNQGTTKIFNLEILAILYLITNESIYYSKIYDRGTNTIYYIESDDLRLAFKKACLLIINDEVKANHFVREVLNRELSRYHFLNLQPFYKFFFTSFHLLPGKWYYFDKEYLYLMESIELELIAELEISDPPANIDHISLAIDVYLQNAYYKYLRLLENSARSNEKIKLLKKTKKIFARIKKQEPTEAILAYLEIFKIFPEGFNNCYTNKIGP
ncbi:MULTISPECIES: hypothetical protein [unclassified Sphingobacterium]|uniref:hypothetical protein n=1 Tax=unclassified Sphingobacterium TaxID=2609468 RepID=UPI0025FC5BAB|nr:MULTISPECIES: hypothetical protein [unclassified Sphingobacterium]